jgi:hypothetical protein
VKGKCQEISPEGTAISIPEKYFDYLSPFVIEKISPESVSDSTPSHLLSDSFIDRYQSCHRKEVRNSMVIHPGVFQPDA